MISITEEGEHTEYFRASVGAMLIHARGSILVLDRAAPFRRSIYERLVTEFSSYLRVKV
jgi:hypothetical protein